MRRINGLFVISFGIAAAFLPLAAQDLFSGYSAEMGTSAGFLYGMSKELVYVSSGSDTRLSELDWAMEPLFYWGLRFDVAKSNPRSSGFFAGIGLKSGLAGKSGTITDTDWANYDGVKTHFSTHDCYTEQALLVDATAGWSFALGRGFALRPYAGLNYMHYRWTARDGYLQYGPNYYKSGDYDKWSSSFEKIDVYGTGMAYEQEWMMLSFGTEVLWDTGDRWTVSAGCSFSPWVSCDDQDDHYLTGAQYVDKTRGGYAVEPKLGATFRYTRTLALGLQASYRYIAGMRGDTTISDIGTSSYEYVENDTAGVEYSVLDIGATLSLRF